MSSLDVHRIVSDSTLAENCYVVAHPDGDAVVVDPGCAVEPIADHVSANGLRVHAVLATHAHLDHVAAAADVVERYSVPFHLHPADERLLMRANFFSSMMLGEGSIRIPPVDRRLGDRTTLRFGALSIAVTHTPGHTAGSVCLAADGELFTGDTVMAEYVGRTDLPGGDRQALDRSVVMLGASHPPDMTVRPGHGPPAKLGAIVADVPGLPEYCG